MKAVILAGGLGTRISEETFQNQNQCRNWWQTYNMHIMKHISNCGTKNLLCV